MKKYFKLSVILFLCIALVLSLTSCFTSSVEYIEWELSADEKKISDGTTTYSVLGDKDFTEFWSLSGNGCLRYYNTVDSAWGTYAHVYRALNYKGILALDIYEDDYFGAHVGMQIYLTEDGRKDIEKITEPELSEACYVFDYSGGKMMAASSELVAMIRALNKDKLVEIYDSELEEKDSITVSALALDGFLIHNFGAFYFDRTTVYYRDYALTGNSPAYTYEVYKLDNDDRDVLSFYLENTIREDISNLGYDWEEGKITEGNDNAARAFSRAVLLITVFLLGILAPAVPLVVSLVLTKKRAWHFIVTDYILLISSGVWLLSGLIAFIILLF